MSNNATSGGTSARGVVVSTDVEVGAGVEEEDDDDEEEDTSVVPGAAETSGLETGGGSLVARSGVGGATPVSVSPLWPPSESHATAVRVMAAATMAS
jgi:hypothetical protein